MAQKRDLHFYRFMGVGAIALLATFGSRVLANAPVPPPASVGTSAIPQDVSEIRAQRRDDLAVDQEMKRLSQKQGQYRERMAGSPARDSVKTSAASAARAKKAPVRKTRK